MVRNRRALYAFVTAEIRNNLIKSDIERQLSDIHSVLDPVLFKVGDYIIAVLRVITLLLAQLESLLQLLLSRPLEQLG